MHTTVQKVRPHSSRGSVSGSSPASTLPASPIGALPESLLYVPFTRAIECMPMEMAATTTKSNGMIKSQSAPSLTDYKPEIQQQNLIDLTDEAACFATPPDVPEDRSNFSIGDTKRERDAHELGRVYEEYHRRRKRPSKANPT